MIKVTKGKLKAEFTDYLWKNMGANKNGWVPEKEGSDAVLKVAPETPVGSKPTYQELVAAGKESEKDGDLKLALAHYLKAFQIKDAKILGNKIEKLEKQIAILDSYNELVKTGKEALQTGESEQATTLFLEAQKLIDNEEIKGLLASAAEMDLN